MDRLCRLTPSLQNQKHKIQSNIFENIFEVANHRDQHKDTGDVSNSLNSYFHSYTYEKNIFSSSFYQRAFFCQFFDRKVLVLMQKYFLIGGDTNQVFIFLLASDKNE